MPNRWPIASGDWSNSAIWSGSIIPTASDDVFANNQTVTINTNISVSSLRNSATGSAVAQGNYIINNGVTITSPTIISSTGSMMLISQSNSATIIGNISCATTASAICLTMSDTSSLTITGSVSTAGNAPNIRGIVNTSVGTLVITGSVNGGGSSTSFGIYKSSGTGTVVITGSINAGTVNGGSTLRNDNNSTNYYILGNIVGGSTNCFLDTTGGGTANIYITGSIIGTTTATTATITKTAGISSVLGDVTGFFSPGIANSTGTTIVNGTIIAGPQSPGVSSTTGTVIATGPFYNVNNRNAVFATNLELLSGSTPIWTFDTETALEQRTLYSTNYPGNFPAINNVRQGVTFGDTGQFTGTVAMPNVSDVFKGVPINNTTGSASFDIQNVWSVATSSLTATGSIGERLRNVSTVAIDAELITTKGTL